MLFKKNLIHCIILTNPSSGLRWMSGEGMNISNIYMYIYDYMFISYLLHCFN